ncbi:MAG: ArnT family glycosyltransferase [Alphaproteobacteria bacterium]
MGKEILGAAARRPLTILSLLCFIAWLPGFFTLPPLDRDESRFAQASKQMIESGNYIDIRFGTEARYAKPAGIYWLQAASAALLSDPPRNTIWPYRLPSLLGAFAAVALTYWAARGFTSRETAFTAAALLGLTALLAAEAKIAKTDAVLLAATVAALGVLMRAYLSARDAAPPPRLALALAGWAALGFGILVKGPVLILIAGVSAIVLSLWDRDWKWLARTRPLWGASLSLLVVLPWLAAIAVESNGEFFARALGKDFGAKIMGGEEMHGGPPGYHTLLAGFTFWPAALLLVPAVVAGIRRRAEPAIRFLLVWAAVVWLAFEIAPTKLPHYVLPAFPALAMLSAIWLMEGKDERVARVISIALFALAGAVLAWIVAFAPNHFGYGSSLWLHAGAAVGLAGISAAVVLALRKRITEAVLAGAIAALVLYTFGGLGTAPRLQQLWLSPRLYEAVQQHRQQDDSPVLVSGYSEPSLIFLLGTDTRIARGKTIAEAVAGGLALVEKRQQQRFLDAVRAKGAQAQALEEIDGLNYSRGRPAHVTLYRISEARP